MDTQEARFLRIFQLALFMKQPQIDIDRAYGYGLEYALDTVGQTRPFLRYFNSPFSIELIQGVPSKIRARVLTYALAEADTGMYPAEALFAYCKKYFSKQSKVLPEMIRLAEYLLIRGELSIHAQFLGQMEETVPEAFCAQMGCRLMLCGEGPAALLAFGQALDLKKKRTRKRKLFLTGLPGFLFLAGLLASGQESLYETALAYIEASRREETLYTRFVRGHGGGLPGSSGPSGPRRWRIVWWRGLQLSTGPGLFHTFDPGLAGP